jgi:predicted SnoaL-like aldol condensation-catalyzing enzyme
MRIVFYLFLMVFITSAQASTEDNRNTVIKFWNLAFNEHKPVEAAKLYLAKDYIQHNPHVASGREAFIKAFKNFYKDKKNLKITTQIKRVIAEDDLVVLHIKKTDHAKDRGTAGVDIFRVKDGKITEHWDVSQKIPEKMAHNGTVF